MEDREQQDLFVGRIAQKIYYRNYNLVYLIYGPLIRGPAFLEEKGSIIYSVDGNKNAFKVVRLRGLMLLSALLFFIWKICQ